MFRRAARISILACVAAGLAATAFGQEKPAPKLVLSQEAWDFGEAWHGTLPKLNLVLTNAGNADLVFRRIKAC